MYQIFIAMQRQNRLKNSGSEMRVSYGLERKNEMSIIEEKGWTVTYIPWEDMEGKPRVAGRFKTTREKDEFLEKIHKPDSGWMDEELTMIGVINDYNYMLPG